MTKPSLLCAMLLCPALAMSAAPELKNVPTAGLADNYMVDGIIESAFRIHSGASQYSLLLSRTGIFNTGTGVDSDERSARLYATLFLESDEGGIWQWQINDRVDACPVDITTAFTDPAAFVSDADNDGVPEIWVAYRTACRGDVSPSTLKLIGYEGKQKFALRGTSMVMLGDESDGGDFEADAAIKASPELLEHARALWMRVRSE